MIDFFKTTKKGESPLYSCFNPIRIELYLCCSKIKEDLKWVMSMKKNISKK